MNPLDKAFLPLQRALDLGTARMDAIARNLAHADTPGWKRLEVDFQSLVNAARTGDEGARMDALRRWEPTLQVDQDAPVDERGNSVTLEREISLLHETLLHHEIATRWTQQRIAGLRLAISGR